MNHSIPRSSRRSKRATGVTIRDGFGQTENVCLLGNFPGEMVKPGAVGKPSPGHHVVLLDVDGNEADDGEIALKLDPRPTCLFSEYMDDAKKTAEVMQGGYYRTGDVAKRDEDGYYTYVGRAGACFQKFGLPPKPVRTGDSGTGRTRRHRGGRSGAQSRRDPLECTKGIHSPETGIAAFARIGTRNIQLRAWTARTLQTHSSH